MDKLEALKGLPTETSVPYSIYLEVLKLGKFLNELQKIREKLEKILLEK